MSCDHRWELIREKYKFPPFDHVMIRRVEFTRAFHMVSYNPGSRASAYMEHTAIFIIRTLAMINDLRQLACVLSSVFTSSSFD